MSMASLDVSLPGQRVGALERNHSGLTSWIPSSSWEAQGQHPRLGVAFLRSPGQRHAGTGLPAWFDNLLPEHGSALRQRLCAAHGIRPRDDYRLLAAIGCDLSGAVEVTDAMAAAVAFADPVGATDDGSGDPVLSEALRFSLAGMQLKLSMSAAGDRLVLGAQGLGTQWIVKLPGQGYPDLPAVERATMTWARLAGFEVPSHRTIATDSLDGVPTAWRQDVPVAYAVQRFDRRDDGSKIHQEDLCQALDAPSSQKYGDMGPHRFTMDGAVKFVGDVAGEDAAREMCRRLGFVVATGNDDAHLKNWSLLWGNASRPSLTPCYDFVATVSWRDQHGWGLPSGPTLALRLGRESLFSRLTDEVLQRHAAASGYAWAPAEIRSGIERARDTWRAAASEMPMRMRDAISEHWRHVPILSAMRPSDMPSG